MFGEALEAVAGESLPFARLLDESEVDAITTAEASSASILWFPRAFSDNLLARHRRAVLPAELAAVRSWLKAGAEAFLANGLALPASARPDVWGIGGTRDMLLEFLAARTVPDEEASTPVYLMYAAYECWMGEQRLNDTPLMPRRLFRVRTSALLNYHGGRAAYLGIRLLPRPSSAATLVRTLG